MLESLHVNMDPAFTKLVDTIMDYLRYSLYRKAVDNELAIVYYDENESIPDLVMSVGKSFDEYMDVVRKGKTKSLRLPVTCEFRITDGDNPCKEWISSDCTYRFTIRRGLAVNGGSDTSSAFVTGHVLHNVEFTFNGTLNAMNELKSVVRHELKHAYTEFMYHNGLTDIDGMKLGDSKDNDEKKKQDYYEFIVNTMKNTALNPSVSFDDNYYNTSKFIIAKSLYLLSDKEISANYSQYYQECLNDRNNMWFDGVYSMYEELYKQIEDGVNVMCVDGENQSVKKMLPFDNEKAVDDMKKYTKFVLRHVPENSEDFKTSVIKRLRLVMDRMEKIYRHVRKNRDDSEYNKFNESVDNYYENLRKKYIEVHGEEYGTVRFLCERNTVSPLYESVIEEIDKEIFS